MSPVFYKDGSVTAGNSSGITDGAAALVVLSEEGLKRFGTRPQARIVDYEISGVAPDIMGIGPVPAVRALLERQHLSLSEIDLIELNEAFAAQVIACDRELGFDAERLNVNGGAMRWAIRSVVPEFASRPRSSTRCKNDKPNSVSQLSASAAAWDSHSCWNAYDLSAAT